MSKDTNNKQEISYIKDENGEINWKAMIPPQFLYINNDLKKREKIEKKYGKSYEELDPIKDNIADSDLICMLGGLRYLLRLRKYKSVKYSIKESGRDYASVNCSIVFKANPEIGENEDVEYSDNACAHTDNTTNFAKWYLLEMATNRALARCIRAYLNLNIVSREELSENSSLTEESPNNSIDSQVENLIKKIENKMKLPNVQMTWEQLKNKLIKDNIEGADKFNSLRDLPKDLLFNLADRLEKKWPTKKGE